SIRFFAPRCFSFFSFFFHHPAPTEIYTLSLHDALPIWDGSAGAVGRDGVCGEPDGGDPDRRRVARGASQSPGVARRRRDRRARPDRKSTRLNSSHDQISYAVFCLKKKKNKKKNKRK